MWLPCTRFVWIFECSLLHLPVCLRVQASCFACSTTVCCFLWEDRTNKMLSEWQEEGVTVYRLLPPEESYFPFALPHPTLRPGAKIRPQPLFGPKQITVLTLSYWTTTAASTFLTTNMTFGIQCVIIFRSGIQTQKLLGIVNRTTSFVMCLKNAIQVLLLFSRKLFLLAAVQVCKWVIV